MRCAAVQDASPAEPLCVDDAVFFVETDVGNGIAFLVEGATGGVWMVSNSSVFEGAEEYCITNASGEQVAFPERVMVASDRDLIMFPTDFSVGLKRAESCAFEENILAFSREEVVPKDGGISNTLADRLLRPNEYARATKEKERIDNVGNGHLLPGQAVSLGPARIEVSAEIKEQDCGGPVLNNDFEVIGVSSHLVEKTGLPDWVIEGTRFEDTRRFALKLDNASWMTIDSELYRKESGFVLENVESLLVFAQITDLLGDNYFRRISHPTENRDVQRWIEQHNKLARKCLEARCKCYYSQSEVDRAVRKMQRGLKRDYEAFVKMVRELEQEAGKVHRVSLPFYKQRLADLEELFLNIRERMEQVEENL